MNILQIISPPAEKHITYFNIILSISARSDIPDFSLALLEK